MSYSVQYMEEEDIPGVIQLLDSVFKRWPHFDLEVEQRDHFTWKFIDVISEPSLISIAKAEGKVVGVSSNVFHNIKMGKNQYLASKGTDAAVYPEYRRMGIISNTMQLRDKTRAALPIDMMWSFTSNPILINMYIKEKREKFPKKIIQLNKITDIEEHLKHRDWKYSKIIQLVFPIIKLKNKILNRRRKDSIKIKIEPINIFQDDFDEFWDKVKNEYNFMVERSSKYMNWRYMDIRAGKYNVWAAYYNNQIIGYCVTRINRDNTEYPEGIIVDLLCKAEYSSAVYSLLENAINYFTGEGINNVKTWLVEKHPYNKIFSSLGFIKSEAQVFIDLRNLRVSDEDWKSVKESDGTNIFFQMGDTDMI